MSVGVNQFGEDDGGSHDDCCHEDPNDHPRVCRRGCGGKAGGQGGNRGLGGETCCDRSTRWPAAA